MRAFVSRLVAPLIAGLVTWLASVGLDLGPEFAASLTNAAVILLVGIFTALYGVVHRLIDKLVNPADAASPDTPLAPPRL